MDFNLQQFLTEMEQRLGDKIDAVDRRLVGVVNIVGHHETRIVVIEDHHVRLKWFVGIMLVGVVAFAGNWLVHFLN